MNLPQKTPDYNQLLQQIDSVYTDGQKVAVQSVQRTLLLTYWQIGQTIVEFEQGGQARAEYGNKLLVRLSDDLSHKFGKGFNRSNLNYMRLVYQRYPDSGSLSHKLTWAHYVELVKLEHDLERNFYEKQAIIERWTIRELKRQKQSSLFLRLVASRDKDGILELAKHGHRVEKPTDVLRDPYVFEFLKVPEPYHIAEKTLETRLLDHLQPFLLELGKGFTFVGRQYRITLNNTHYKVDLVFYHRLLRCFVLIDLKVAELDHADIGQMNMYLGYFAEEENAEGDNPPIGLILTREKDDLLVKYATYGMNSQLFVSKYQLYLPDADQLRQTLEAALEADSN